MARFFALVPAGGSGARMGSAVPKQYLPLAGRPMIRHGLERLCAEPRIGRVFVVLAPDDDHWARHDWSDLADGLGVLHCGGATRAQTVANGLAAVAAEVGPEDWVLVHDAARPCLDAAALGGLIDALADDPVGGLLAVPLADTLKRAGPGQRVAATEPRAGLWQAQTPQMFRRELLQRALAGIAPEIATDEASAVEALGLAPRLVAGSLSNFKVTLPADLEMAEWVLAGRAGTKR